MVPGLNQDPVNMPTVGELINNIAQKAGIAADDAKLKSLLASPELANVQVDQELATAVDSALISMDAAKNNHPEIRNKYTSDVYDIMDKNLFKILDEGDFSDDDKAEIKAEPKTRERYALAISKLKALKSKASGANKEEIDRQIAAAHESARLAKAELETVKKSHATEIQGIRKGAAVKAMFGNYKTIYDELPAEIRTATMEAIINKAIQDKNAELITDENGNLKLVSKDGSSNVFSENHTLLTPQSLFDKALAPILKVSGSPKPGDKNRLQTPPVVIKAADDKTEVMVEQIKSHADKVILEMNSQPAGMI